MAAVAAWSGVGSYGSFLSAEPQTQPSSSSLPLVEHAGASGADTLRRSDLHLVQTQVVFRHGARTPVHRHAALDTTAGWSTLPRLPLGAPPVACVLASNGEPMPRPLHELRVSPLRFGELGMPAGCLTQGGINGMAAAGAALRERYGGDVDSEFVMPAGQLDPATTYLR